MLERDATTRGGLDVVRERHYQGECFVVETRPPDGAPVRDAAVLVLPPLGYEDTCSYRPLRVLAEALAREGHVVVRPDWPGLGDSAGDALDPDLVPRQLAAVRQLTERLRTRGFTSVLGLGVRAGGLLGLAAGGLDGIVLWGTPASGKRYLREEKAFHRMAAKAFSAPPADRPPLLAGAVEAGGFLYGPRTVADLQALDVAAGLAAGAPRRALLIPREGTDPPPELQAALDHAGVDVARVDAGGLGDLLEDPYRSALAPAVRDAVVAFCAQGAAIGVPRPTVGAAFLSLPGGVTERPWLTRGGAGILSGVICEPSGGAPPGATWTLFFNAGGVRRAGPNRLWTRAARALAAEGRPSLRLDVRDVGDSDGANIPHADLEEMYAESSILDAVEAYDAVRERGAGAVDVVGLCSGAFLGVQVSARRPVRHAVLFNGLAFVWNDDARASGMTAHIRGSLLDTRRWRRLLTGRIDARALARAIVDKSRLRLGEELARLRGRPPRSEVALLLETVAHAGTELHLVSSEGDPSITYLERHLGDAARPRHSILPGVDHTIRPVWAHDRVVDLVRGLRPPAAVAALG